VIVADRIKRREGRKKKKENILAIERLSLK
jgi:hypothetical protein